MLARLIKTTEQATDEEINWQLNLNLMGVIRMTKAVLPIMRSQRENRVINISLSWRPSWTTFQRNILCR